MLKNLVIRELKNLIERLDTGNSEITDEEAMNILGVIANEAMSKDQACSYLNISRSRFDELVRNGELPKGRKRRGFKELVWYRSDLFLTTRKAKVRK